MYKYLKSTHPNNSLYYAVDSTRLENNRWVSIILRNLPDNCALVKIAKKCSEGGEKVLYADNPIQIKK